MRRGESGKCRNLLYYFTITAAASGSRRSTVMEGVNKGLYSLLVIYAWKSKVYQACRSETCLVGRVRYCSVTWCAVFPDLDWGEGCRPRSRLDEHHNAHDSTRLCTVLIISCLIYTPRSRQRSSRLPPALISRHLNTQYLLQRRWKKRSKSLHHHQQHHRYQ
jgi:hypothetical protein